MQLCDTYIYRCAYAHTFTIVRKRITHDSHALNSVAMTDCWEETATIGCTATTPAKPRKWTRTCL